MGVLQRQRARDALKVTPSDTVAVALRDLAEGATIEVDGVRVTLIEPVARGHKLALRAIAAGEPVVKYGAPIGVATAPIAPGAHVHTHNVKTSLSGLDRYAYEGSCSRGGGPAPDGGSFKGYARAGGRVGTRNEIWIIATVGCVARVSEKIARAGDEKFKGRVDGVHAITHPFGCSQLGDDLDGTRAILAALAAHPNAGGVLFMGLGCESNQLDDLLASAPDLDRARVAGIVSQQVEDEFEAGIAAVEALVVIAERESRVDCPASALVLGLKCGGSDGFSGLTANPLVGRMADRVTAAGGSAILTEIPEIFGAERVLLRRAENETVFNDLVAVVNDFKRYFLDHDQPIHENPSPGNIAGGITTLEEKSLGAVQKAGAASVADVRRYGERVRRRGLTILEAPGNDAVSSTALAAAGATLILFTTGRGTPLGFPVPTMKISSNSALAEKKPQWIDFDAGAVLLAGSSDETAGRLYDALLDHASGRPTRNEENDERSIAIWKRGVTL